MHVAFKMQRGEQFESYLSQSGSFMNESRNRTHFEAPLPPGYCRHGLFLQKERLSAGFMYIHIYLHIHTHLCYMIKNVFYVKLNCCIHIHLRILYMIYIYIYIHIYIYVFISFFLYLFMYL